MSNGHASHKSTSIKPNMDADLPEVRTTEFAPGENSPREDEAPENVAATQRPEKPQVNPQKASS